MALLNPPNSPAVSSEVPSITKTGSDSLLDSILSQNPYFSAGFGLMGVGVALSGLKRSSTILFNLAQRRLLVTLEISSKDRSYLWFLNWMSKQSRKNSSTNQLAAETSYRQLSDGTHEVDFALVPGPGNHYFKFQRAWFQVKRERDGKLIDLNSGTPWETLMLTTLSRDRKLLVDLFRRSRMEALRSTSHQKTSE